MSQRSLHLVGVGGIGMSGIAQILVHSGFKVSGSDLCENTETTKLKELGAIIFKGHRKENLSDADMVVVSSAIAADNPEILEAKRRNIPILSRAQMLAELMRKKQSIVVAGAHGKTTTSAMITTILLEAGFDPTAVIGGRLNRIAGNAKMGSDEWFVAESDESDGSFLTLLPTIAVITNLDHEHLDHYGSYAKLEQAFVDFANRVPFDGVVILCTDNRALSKIVRRIERPILSYGINNGADFQATDIVLSETGVSFTVSKDREHLCDIQLPLPGNHNVRNALGSITVALNLGIPPAQISKGLLTFGGIGRRLELKATCGKVRVLDDYAHHPTEIGVTLEALCLMKGQQGRVRVLFQPHRYTRVGGLWDGFVSAFDEADEVVILPIYAASEKPIEGVNATKLAEAVSKRSKARVKTAVSLEQGAELICKDAEAGDLIVTMGAGDVTKAGSMIGALLTKGSPSTK